MSKKLPVLRTVTVLIALLYDSIWREVGEVLQMEEFRAKTLAEMKPPHLAFGEHVLTVAADGSEVPAADPVFTPADFPGAEYLVAVGVTNTDQLGELIQTKGDGWFTGIKGLGKKTAALIADALANLQAEKPAAKPTTKAKAEPAPAAAPEPAPAAEPAAEPA